MLSASRSACTTSLRTPVPGKSGRPSRTASARALTLSPQVRIEAGEGPMKVSPH